MAIEVIFNLGDLHKLRTITDRVRVAYRGGQYRARMSGSNVVAFGETPTQAKQRLNTLHVMQSACLPKFCDVIAERRERAEERVAVARAAKNLIKFNPKGK